MTKILALFAKSQSEMKTVSRSNMNIFTFTERPNFGCVESPSGEGRPSGGLKINKQQTITSSNMCKSQK